MKLPEGKEHWVWWPSETDQNRLLVTPQTRALLNDYLKMHGFVLPDDHLTEEERDFCSEGYDA